MLVFNQQANIKNVNGAIADIFANRPAAQSTYYIFYSTDTQEIYYDNGAWILLAAAGGTPVNIYNSDGTLTGNRILDFGGNILKTSDNGQDWGIRFNNTFNEVSIGDYFGNYSSGIISIGTGGFDVFTGSLYKSWRFGFNVMVEIAYMELYGNFWGLKFDNLIGTYEIGTLGSGNNTNFKIDDTNQIIKTINQGNDIGLKLDFANQDFYFGNISSNNTIYFNSNNGDYEIRYNGGYLFAGNASNGNFQVGNINIANSIIIDSDNFNKRFVTNYNNQAVGLYLDFQNDSFQLGKQTGGNLTFIEVWDSQNLIRFKNGGIVNGLECDYNTNEFKIGDVNGQFNNNQIKVNDQTNFIELGKAGKTVLQIDNDTLDTLKTVYIGNDIGLKLDFANTNYQFGQISGGNTTYLSIDDATNYARFFNANAEIGLGLNFTNRLYQLGDYAGNFNQSLVYVDDLNGISGIIGNNGLQNIGLFLDSNNIYPVQINGTNVLSGTAGSTSGQHLKIKINGVDYKIELKNP